MKMIDHKYPLHPYFTEMPGIGSELARTLKKNIEELQEQEGDRRQGSRAR